MRTLPNLYCWLALIAMLAAPTLIVAKGPSYTDPKKTDADFPFQGEYVGKVGGGDNKVKVGVQVIALGKGNFHAVAYRGGLPGDGWDGQEKIAENLEGKLEDGVVTFASERGVSVIADSVLTITSNNGAKVGELKRVTRKSPTLGAKPPENATVLFDGSNADSWENGKSSSDGMLLEGTRSKQKFGSHKVHIEFRIPYQPEDRGQGRGNSGIYLQGRYEVQMLDSFGLEGRNNECGGIYELSDPAVNMCLPPLTWQTYDIDFTAAKFDDAGNLTEEPRLTVKHNGVVVQDNVKIPQGRVTRAAPVKTGPEAGPVYLQNHNNPVRYRNIWVVETDK